MTTTYSILHAHNSTNWVRKRETPSIYHGTMVHKYVCINLFYFWAFCFFKKFYFILFPLTSYFSLSLGRLPAWSLSRFFNFRLLFSLGKRVRLLCVNMNISGPSIATFIYYKYVLCAWHLLCAVMCLLSLLKATHLYIRIVCVCV